MTTHVTVMGAEGCVSAGAGGHIELRRERDSLYSREVD